MPANRNQQILKRRASFADEPVFMRGIISPCTGCQNKFAVSKDIKSNKKRSNEQGWPCPKSILYAHKEWSKSQTGKLAVNYDGPLYDETLKGINPVFAGVNGRDNGYSYAYIATYEDNVETGWNPGFNTEIIRCRGPYLLTAPERLQKILGILEQQNHILAFSRYYYLDGSEFMGFVMEAATWQVHTSATRRTDTNLDSSTSGAQP